MVIRKEAHQITQYMMIVSGRGVFCAVYALCGGDLWQVDGTCGIIHQPEGVKGAIYARMENGLLMVLD
jgi:hypothetical protein